MSIAGPMVINACATVPSGPGRRTRSTASNVFLQEINRRRNVAAKSLGMTTDAPSGIPFIPPPCALLNPE